jgi:hypothetical protein
MPVAAARLAPVRHQSIEAAAGPIIERGTTHVVPRSFAKGSSVYR